MLWAWLLFPGKKAACFPAEKVERMGASAVPMPQGPSPSTSRRVASSSWGQGARLGGQVCEGSWSLFVVPRSCLSWAPASRVASAFLYCR